MAVRKRGFKDDEDFEAAPRKKDKLPPKPRKPWGRKERSFVLFFVGGTSILALFLAIFSRHGKLPGLPRLSTESLGLEETVVLTKTTTPPNVRQRENQIILQFSELVSKLSGIYAFTAVDLKTGNAYGVNELERMQAASLIKLPVMSLLLKTADQGKINLDSVYILKEEDKVGGAGSIYYKEAGTAYTYRELLRLMGKQSDNTAFNVVRKKLGDEAIYNFMNDIGMKNTNLEENITTPGEIALLLRKVYEGRVMEQSSRELLYESLTDTAYENYLPTGVPDDIQVAHKYGREIHVINDAGIVFGEKPYVVVIMTDGIVEAEAEKIFTTLSQIIYEGQSS